MCEGSLSTTQPGAGYSSFPSRAASLPPNQERDTVVFKAGQPHYHPAERGIQQYSDQGSLTTTQVGAGYSSFPSTAASPPPSQVRDTVVFQAGPPHYHPARCRIQRPNGQGSFATTQPGRGYSSSPGRAASLPPSQVGNTTVCRAGHRHYHQAGW
ncbi:unnamed protein product [Sphagnum jensenii]|uniref:Uncharacterized protein n=1 Tax=Sphagnum jensenii TaxID=128206 RepID=A0ABP1AFR7_9BRYO